MRRAGMMNAGSTIERQEREPPLEAEHHGERDDHA